MRNRTAYLVRIQHDTITTEKNRDNKLILKIKQKILLIRCVDAIYVKLMPLNLSYKLIAQTINLKIGHLKSNSKPLTRHYGYGFLAGLNMLPVPLPMPKTHAKPTELSLPMQFTLAGIGRPFPPFPWQFHCFLNFWTFVTRTISISSILSYSFAHQGSGTKIEDRNCRCSSAQCSSTRRVGHVRTIECLRSNKGRPVWVLCVQRGSSLNSRNSWNKTT